MCLPSREWVQVAKREELRPFLAYVIFKETQCPLKDNSVYELGVGGKVERAQPGLLQIMLFPLLD